MKVRALDLPVLDQAVVSWISGQFCIIHWRGVVLIIKRYGSTPLGTFGKLDVMGGELVTVEKPWRDNQRYISCVPLGRYELLWRPTTTPVPAVYKGHTWYLYGDEVGFNGDGKQRFNCCLHIGNVESDVEGCIASGTEYGYPRDQWGVIHSRSAMEILYSAIGPVDTELVIIGNMMG